MMRELTDLSEKECRDLLARCSVGRVSFATPMGPRTVPINYAMDGWAIVFRTTPYSELGTYGGDAEVVFEVDEIDEEQHVGQSVVAYGRAQVLDAKDLLHLSWKDEPQPWAGGRRDRYFRIETREVTGRRVGGERDVADCSDRIAASGVSHSPPRAEDRPDRLRAARLGEAFRARFVAKASPCTDARTIDSTAGGVRPDSMTILLVEDNPDDVELTRQALREGVPATIEVARDGQQALDYLFDESHDLPRLVVLDLRLPRPGDGLEVLRRIRENERTQLTPVVILTSSEDPDDLVRGYRLGANSYVRKPLDYEEFAGLVRQLGTYWLRINQVDGRQHQVSRYAVETAGYQNTRK